MTPSRNRRSEDGLYLWRLISAPAYGGRRRSQPGRGPLLVDDDCPRQLQEAHHAAEVYHGECLHHTRRADAENRRDVDRASPRSFPPTCRVDAADMIANAIVKELHHTGTSRAFMGPADLPVIFSHYMKH